MWFWDGHEHVDPLKEATYPPTRRVASRSEVATSGAQEKRLANNTTTLAAEYAKQGKDWETELRQRAKEKKLMDELGIAGATTVVSPEEEKEDEMD